MFLYCLVCVIDHFLDAHKQREMRGTVKSQRADKVNAETVAWVALLKPVHTESNNYKDN